MPLMKISFCINVTSPGKLLYWYSVKYIYISNVWFCIFCSTLVFENKEINYEYKIIKLWMIKILFVRNM